MQSTGSSRGAARPQSEERSAAIRQRLRATGSPGLRQIECECRGDQVILRGHVPTYYVKQLAQSLLLADPAIRGVENLIEVV